MVRAFARLGAARDPATLTLRADVAELVDAHGSGPCGLRLVEVQVLSSASLDQAESTTHPGSVNVNSVGWILVVFGLIGFLADLVLWSSWGPGYLRRRTYVEDPGYGAYPARRGYPDRRVIEEDEVGPQGPGY